MAKNLSSMLTAPNTYRRVSPGQYMGPNGQIVRAAGNPGKPQVAPISKPTLAQQIAPIASQMSGFDSAPSFSRVSPGMYRGPDGALIHSTVNPLTSAVPTAPTQPAQAMNSNNVPMSDTGATSGSENFYVGGSPGGSNMIGLTGSALAALANQPGGMFGGPMVPQGGSNIQSLNAIMPKNPGMPPQ